MWVLLTLLLLSLSLLLSSMVDDAPRCALMQISFPPPPTPTKAVLSEHDTSKSDGEQVVKVKRVITHPDYKKAGGVRHDHDYALVELAVGCTVRTTTQPTLASLGAHTHSR